MQRVWIWRTDATTPQLIGTQRITPKMQTIGLRWRGGGWLWQFPLAVDVEDTQTGDVQRVPIPDITRTAVWLCTAITLGAVLATIIVWQRGRMRRKDN